MTLLRFVLSVLLVICNLHAAKIKDLVSVKGVRENPLIGYGLVIGLNGTGDSGGEVTNTSLISMFQNLGLNLQQEMASKNVAAVIVTAKLPPFARMGQKVDITVSSVASATSLGGGTLLVTPLRGGDGHVYAVASGAVSIGGLTQGSRHATTAFVSNGAYVEKEMGLEFNNKKSVRLSLHNPDFTTAARIQKVINRNLGGKFSVASDATTIDVMVPPHYHRKVVPLISIIENFKINPSKKAKVVINERTGTIIAGGDVLLENVAISHGNLTIEIKDLDDNDSSVRRNDKFYLMEQGASLSNLVKALNGLGANPEDIISIFKALNSNGSLAGEVTFI